MNRVVGVFSRAGCCALLALSAGCSAEAERSGVRESEATSVRADPLVVPFRRCGTREPTAAELTQAEQLDAKSEAEVEGARVPSDDSPSKTGSKPPAFSSRGRVIPVYFHVITHSSGEGDVTPLIARQMAVLNKAYQGAGFKFKLVSADVVENDDWYLAPPESELEFEMKSALRVGDADALNVYTTVNDGTLLGWATPPAQYREIPIYDGVVVLNLTLPGGGLEIPVEPESEPDGVVNYSGGDTLTHEVGHWLGLAHTFDGGCSLKNDRVLDTPAEAEPQIYCVRRDSCRGRWFPGTDPIHNFMDYVDDDCMNHFTSGQVHRMRRQYAFFRAR